MATATLFAALLCSALLCSALLCSALLRCPSLLSVPAAIRSRDGFEGDYGPEDSFDGSPGSPKSPSRLEERKKRPSQAAMELKDALDGMGGVGMHRIGSAGARRPRCLTTIFAPPSHRTAAAAPHGRHQRPWRQAGPHQLCRPLKRDRAVGRRRLVDDNAGTQVRNANRGRSDDRVPGAPWREHAPTTTKIPMAVHTDHTCWACISRHGFVCTQVQHFAVEALTTHARTHGVSSLFAVPGLVSGLLQVPCTLLILRSKPWL